MRTSVIVVVSLIINLYLLCIIRYDEVVTVSVKETVHVTKYKWCLGIPPRCPDNKQEYRTVYKNIVSKTVQIVFKSCIKIFNFFFRLYLKSVRLDNVVKIKYNCMTIVSQNVPKTSVQTFNVRQILSSVNANLGTSVIYVDKVSSVNYNNCYFPHNNTFHF